MSDLSKELSEALMSGPAEPEYVAEDDYDGGSVRVISMEVDNCYACPFHNGEFYMCLKTQSEFYGTKGARHGILKDCPLPRKGD